MNRLRARHEAQAPRKNRPYEETTTIRKTILTVVAATLFAASTAQFAVASEHHRAHKVMHASAVERFSNASA
jgi:hypothetical protein